MADTVIIYERCPKQRIFLEAAVLSNDYARVQKIIENGADVNDQNEHGDTVLHIAVTHHHNSKIVDVLITAGVDVNIQNTDGRTALHLALKDFDNNSSDRNESSEENDSTDEEELTSDDSEDMVLQPCIRLESEIFRESATDDDAVYVNEIYARQMTALEQFNDDTDTDTDTQTVHPVTNVLNASREKNNTAVDQTFDTELVAGAENEHRNGSKQNCHIQTLISAGTDVNIQDVYGNTSLHLALIRSHEEALVESLINAGKKIPGVVESELHSIALQLDNYMEVKALLDAGVDVNKQNINGTTSLHLAAKSNNHKLIQKLFNAGADLNIQDEDGKTALHYASIYGHFDKSVITLIQSGIDVNKEDTDGNTALHRAVIAKRPEGSHVIERLVHAGADINKQNVEGNTPLHAAIVSTQEDENIQTLITLGADVNKQNADGNTPLHLAILNHETPIGILRILLEDTPTIFAMNIDGLDPIQLIWTFDMFLRLLKLQKYFNYRDRFGNTIVHVLMMNWSYSDEWNYVLEQLTKLDVSFDTQNENGQTPLHVVALSGNAFDDVPFILDHFENINVFCADKNGNTFFHTYLENFIYASPVETKNFIMCLLEGRYKNCPAETVKKLLRVQNRFGKTPLIIYLERFQLHLQLFETFLMAGTDITCCSICGDSILHYLVAGHNKDDVMKLAITYGANVNVQNSYGESPIFLVENDNSKLTLLLDFGTDLQIRNKFGQTPLLVQMFKSQSSTGFILDTFLAKGADVNETDMYGSNLLHYAAWCDADKSVIDQLRAAGIKCVRDKVGQLPCDVAERRGNKTMLDELCICTNATHAECFKQEFIDFEKKMQLTTPFIESLRLRQKLFERHAIVQVLNVPSLGLVKYEGESCEIRETVVEIIRHLCALIGEEDEILCNTVFQSGSVGENTKIGFPNEFDFMCLISVFPKLCEIDEELSKQDANYAYVKLKKECKRHKVRSLFNNDGFLEPRKVSKRFTTALKKVMQHPSVFRHPNISFTDYKQRGSLRSPNCQFTLRWTGAVFKDMAIDIDLVPACQFKNWWPVGSRLCSLACDQETIQNEGALILFRGNIDHPSGLKTRISALNAEKSHMLELPQVARDAYVISKMLFDPRICPEVFNERRQAVCDSAKVSSYILKNCMFHVFEEAKENSAWMGEHVVSVSPTEILHDYVCKIVNKLIEFASSDNLPSFVFPWQNIFSFQSQLLDPSVQTHKECSRRVVYSKLVLDILGDKECYSDVFEDILLDYTDERDSYIQGS